MPPRRLALPTGTILLLAAPLLGAPPTPASGAETCPPARVAIGKVWSPARDVGRFSDRRVSEVFLGDHATARYLDMKLSIERSCLGPHCHLCLKTLVGHAGYLPSRIRLEDDMARSPCHARHVLAHEARHSAHARDAEILLHRDLAVLLAPWTRPHPSVHATPATLDEAQAALNARLQAAVHHAAERADAWREQRDTALDSLATRTIEHRAMRDACGPSPVDRRR